MKHINPISSLAFLIVLYVSRNAIPYAAYLLMVLLFSFTVYQLVNFNKIVQALKKTTKLFFPVILLIFIEIIALFGTVFPFHGRSIDIIKDIIFISVFLFLLSYNIQSKEDFRQFIEKIGKYFILFTVVVSLLGLWKFFYSPQIISYKYVDEIRCFKWGSSLVSDYNFFSLFLLNGLAFGLYAILHLPERIKYKTLFLLALQLIITTGVFSGSRRFLFCLGFFFIVSFLLLIPFMFKKIFSNRFTYKYLLRFLALSLLNLAIVYSFLSYFPLISEKAEKIFFIDAHKTSINIVSVSSRINSVASFRFIKVHSITKQLSDLNKKEIVSVTSSRKELWVLGGKIYREYTVLQKMFGKGFTFFEIFKKETGRFLYPHHLFLSVLLFSGILGLTIYIAVLLWSSMIYLFHLKNLKILFFLFVINFIFGFFSFTEFFGATFYSILMVLPLLYRYLYKYEKNIPIPVP